ncbi:MAG: glycosyltransferase family 4 protein [Aquabacterium sp.]
MKICLINTLYHPYQVGGAERSVQILAESYVRLGHEAVVITLGQQDERQTHNGVRIIRKTLQNAYWPFTDTPKNALQKIIWHSKDIRNAAMGKVIGAILDEEKPDVVHTNNLAGFSVAAWDEVKRRHIRLIHTLRDYYLLCYRTTMYKQDQNCVTQCTDCKLLSLPKKSGQAQPDCAVGISDYVLSRHLKFGFFRQSEQAVIFNSYDPPPCTEPGHADRPLTFGYIGRLAESKGLETLINAFREIAKQHPVQLRIAGKGNPAYVEGLQRLAGDAPISFIGHSDLPSFFGAIDFTVVPSLWHEPLGRVVIESYAHGVPVIASSTGALPEIVTSGQTGYLYNTPAQLVELMQSMVTLSSGSRQALKLNCERRAAECFTSARVAEQYLALYAGQAPTR